MNFLYEHTSLITDDDLFCAKEVLVPYIKHLQKVARETAFSFNESSINLPFDEELIKNIISLKEKLASDRLKYVIDIGIGGSNLGTKAIYDSLLGFFDVIEPNKFPKIIFVDTNDSNFLYKLINFFNKCVKDENEILVNLISKSGETIETIANTKIILNSLESKGLNVKRRTIITTQKESGLWKYAKMQGYECLSIPEKVGGRYSVFSAAGLFPLICVKIDILNLLKGAMEIRQQCLDLEILKNPAAVSAIILYLNYRKGKYINDNFYFASELESLGKWYRQLMAESIGKDGLGITPTVSVGSTDLHSMGQLYLGGPKNKLFSFVWVEKTHDNKIPSFIPFSNLVEETKGKTTQQVMSAIYEGVKISYKKNDLPYTQTILENISEKELGKYLQFKMIEIMYLAKLLNVNAFDQPSIEQYKLETQRILWKNS